MRREAAAILAGIAAGWLGRSEVARRREARARARTFAARWRTATTGRGPNAWLWGALRRIDSAMEHGSAAASVTVQATTADGDPVAWIIRRGDEHPTMALRGPATAGGWTLIDLPDDPRGLGGGH